MKTNMDMNMNKTPNMIIKSVAFEAARGLMADISDAHPWTNTSGLCENSQFYMVVHKDETGYMVSCCKGPFFHRVLERGLTKHSARECLRKYIERLLMRS